MATKAKRSPAKKAPKVPPITMLETAFAHIIIRDPRKSPAEAAVELGLEAAAGARYLARKPVQEYMSHYRALFAEKMAEREVDTLVKRNITRESIAERYLALADMPPERTKGSIEGQVKALIAAEELLGLKFDPKTLPAALAQMSDEQLRAYAGTPQ